MLDTEHSELEALLSSDSVSMTAKIIDLALTGKHKDFEYIKSMSELSVAKLVRQANGKLSSGFYRAVSAAEKDYLKKLHQGIFDMTLLTNIRTFKICANFYATEYNLLTDSISEFTYYLLSGHLIDIGVLHKERVEEDLHDFRPNKK